MINMPAAFLSKLLQRYPDGKIFNFNSSGELLPSDLSEEDRLSQDEKIHLRSQNKAVKQASKPWARHREGQVLLEAIPNAVSAIFVPIWDSRKDRWYAGGFVYTCTPRRLFTAGGELSYIRAFGMLTMAEVIRRDIAIADKAKMDALGSLSHELRSPLHGVVLGVELLQDTDLGVFQGNILHTIETCGRTLVDTLDHLLDFSKVNHLATSQKDRTQQSGRTLVRQMSFGAGSKSLSSEVRIDSLAEEVVESVFAGFNFKHASAAQLSQHRQTTFAEPPGAQRHRDAQHSALDFGSDLTPKGDMSLDFSKVAVVLSINAAENWQFYTQPGALRRIIMNLFGNALKYTEKGMIHVSIRQEESPRKSRHGGRVVTLTVADTGKGISEDYLRNDLFKPFSQEDHLSSGTGLGLSLVKKITTSLGGSIHVESQVGLGTIASVSLPLMPAMHIPSQTFKISEEEEVFKAQVSELKGLRVALVGFRNPSDLGENHRRILSERQADYHELMVYTCRAWLHMEVLAEEEAEKVSPDFTLAIGTAFERLNGSSSAQPPCIVVCDDALQAYHQTVSHSNAYLERVFEFISQPVGPRKLAKVLVLAFNRWLDIQECPKPPSLTRSRSSFNTSSTSHMHTPATETYMSTQRSTKPLSRTSLQSMSTKSMRSHLHLEPHNEIPPGSRYLLVDDNAINLKILVSYMKKLRREFDTAKNGQEAVDLYTSRPKAFACILMDISMPVMDGFEATKQIRELERKQHLDAVTVIALTGLASEDAQQEAYGSGVDLFLTKPAKLKDLEVIFKDRNMA
ncbi:hypothetical protein N3K66_005182 [Trichothecium roseum]|uniref:Uncharacterized protein n=1 Tax=Trichothecium roseum TaxID=47278 RepID=A0ACC0V4S0_9HYPO|nr:hypothetical protein N3K66_005182 [Trichothecium roseum]